MIRVVIADDHAMFRQGLVRLLQSEEMEVVAECSSGVEVMAAVRAHHPDILLLDVTMPGRDGISVAEEVVVSALPTRVVMLTMHDGPDISSRALAAGVAGYIVKDVAFDELVNAMYTVMRGKTFISPSISQGLACYRERGLPALTSREQEILRLIAQGNSNRQIAEELSISIKTVDAHRTNLMRKLDLHTTADLVRHALQTGIC